MSVCSTQYIGQDVLLVWDQDIKSAVQNRDHWIKTTHIDYTTYFQLIKQKDYNSFTVTSEIWVIK